LNFINPCILLLDTDNNHPLFSLVGTTVRAKLLIPENHILDAVQSFSALYSTLEGTNNSINEVDRDLQYTNALNQVIQRCEAQSAFLDDYMVRVAV
jgi:hypothetical protein